MTLVKHERTEELFVYICLADKDNHIPFRPTKNLNDLSFVSMFSSLPVSSNMFPHFPIRILPRSVWLLVNYIHGWSGFITCTGG